VTTTLVVAAAKAMGLATVMVSAAVLAVEHKTVNYNAGSGYSGVGR
jgi:hypothetical protein